ncbi:MAG TPA: hypothetical protein VLJ11_16740 [Bryobacteraceae bacterium]|nr:hypothetical protein [Bryobacteraceae bacterium]
MQDFEAVVRSAEREVESPERQAARLQLTNELNQLLRRLRSYSNEAEWTMALNEGASRFAGESAIFAVESGALRLRAQRGLDLPHDLSVPLSSAAAFSAAMQSKDPVVALRTPAEVGEALSNGDRRDRAHIFPIQNGSRLAAVMFAAGRERIDINGLELLAGVASLALQRPENMGLHTQIAPVSVLTAVPPEPEAGQREKGNRESPTRERSLPAWTNLPLEERDRHIRAQRFARVKVAQMEISKPEACRAGRKDSNFYLFLKREIDSARDSYRKQFMTTPHMSDYLHLELVRTAVEGQEQKLGADYPGQLD